MVILCGRRTSQVSSEREDLWPIGVWLALDAQIPLSNKSVAEKFRFRERPYVYGPKCQRINRYCVPDISSMGNNYLISISIFINKLLITICW